MVTLFFTAANATYYAIYAGKILLGLGGPQLGITTDKGIATWWRGVVAFDIADNVGSDFLLWTGLGVVAGLGCGLIGGAIVVAVANHLGPAPRRDTTVVSRR